MALPMTNSERSNVVCAVCGVVPSSTRTVIHTSEGRVPGSNEALAICVSCLIRVVISAGRQTLARVAK